MYLDGIQDLYLSILNHHYVLKEGEAFDEKTLVNNLDVQIGNPRGLFRRWVWARIAIPIQAVMILVQSTVMQLMRAIGGLVGSACCAEKGKKGAAAIRALENLASLPVQIVAIVAIGLVAIVWPKAAEKICKKVYSHHKPYKEEFDKNPGMIFSGVTLLITTISTIVKEPLDIIKIIFSLKDFRKIPGKIGGTIAAPFIPLLIFVSCCVDSPFNFGSGFYGIRLNLVTKSH